MNINDQLILIIIIIYLRLRRETSDLDGVWKEPKYLLCPASFTVSQLSKFVVMKIGMDANKFLVS